MRKRTRQGSLDPRIEDELHEFSDKLRVNVVEEVQKILGVRFGDPSFLESKTFLDFQSGLPADMRGEIGLFTSEEQEDETLDPEVMRGSEDELGMSTWTLKTFQYQG